MELVVSEIRKQIHSVRGYQVVLDRDLATFYQIETKSLKRTVRRNIKRFPKDFMFELDTDEINGLRTHLGTLELTQGGHGGTRYSPFAFTEQGIAMLSGVLDNERAIEVSIAVMRAFVEFRQLSDRRSESIVDKNNLESRLEGLEGKLDRLIASTLSKVKVKDSVAPSDLPRFRDDAKVQKIERAVASYFEVQAKALKDRSRIARIALARHIAIYLLRKYTNMSFSEIGSFFGGRNHTTMVHAYKKIATAIEVNDTVRNAVEAIEKFDFNSVK